MVFVGLVMLAGPLSDASRFHRAMIVFEASGRRQVRARLAEDPWTPTKVLTTAALYRWDVLIGDLSR